MPVLVKLQVSKKLLRFTPSDTGDFSRDPVGQETGEIGAKEDEFDVTVINTTNRFASFQVELAAEGMALGQIGQTGQMGQTARWYKVEPEVGAKQPPGDRTTFHITLLKAPIPAYDTQLNLQVKAFSVEVNDIESTETVQLHIGRPKKSLRAYLPFQELTVYPGDRIKIPALIYNLSASFSRITLRLRGVDASWIQGGRDRIVQIESGGFAEELFWCNPPPSAKSRHQTYDLVLEAFDAKNNTASDVAHLQVLPFGQVRLTCEQPEQQISPLRLRWVNYPLDFVSESNQTQQISIGAAAPDEVMLTLPDEVVLEPEGQVALSLMATAKPPWIGRRRRHLIEVTPTLLNPETGSLSAQDKTQPASQLLSLDVRPVLPLWLQLGSGLLLLLLTLLFWWLSPPRVRHTSDVNSVRLIANEETVVSGSSDQTIRRWQVNDRMWVPNIRRLRYKGVIASGRQGIRVVRQLPAEVAQVAAGLENGDIQFWPISPVREQPVAVIEGNNDRVFDLVFTEDSKYLYSAHGSGRVRQWIQGAPNTWQAGSVLRARRSASLSAIAVSEAVGEPTLVAIAGQYNQLILWNPQQNQAYKIKYGLAERLGGAFSAVVSQNSYLTDIAIAQRPNDPESALLVTADNQGFVTLWDLQEMRRCIGDLPAGEATEGAVDVDCDRARIDQWQENPQGLAVRSVSLSANGCYLASTGDSGYIRLWPLTAAGNRQLDHPLNDGQQKDHSKGIVLDQFSGERLNSVSIQSSAQVGDQATLLIASDAPENRVRLYRQQVRSYGCQ